MPEPKRFESYEEFWRFYVREHSKRSTRMLHFAGTTLALSLLVFSIASQRWLLLPIVPVVGYGLSWVGHFFFERNKPAAFGNPWWSFLSDLRMCLYIVTFRMGREVEMAADD